MSLGHKQTKKQTKNHLIAKYILLMIKILYIYNATDGCKISSKTCCLEMLWLPDIIHTDVSEILDANILDNILIVTATPLSKSSSQTGT